MNLLIKKLNITLFLLIILFIESKAFARDNNTQYTRENVSNYFSGVVSARQNYDNNAFKYLNEIKSINNKHSQFNTEFIRALVLTGKFKEAFAFSKDVWSKDELFYEADLLLGLNSFLNQDYNNAEKYFLRLNKISRSNIVFNNFIGNILMAWIKAEQDDRESSLKFIKSIPKPYYHLKRVQKIFLKCYFNDSETQKEFEALIDDKEYNFSRYNFFLTNYLLSQNKFKEAKKTIKIARKKYDSNLLLQHTEYFLLKNEYQKVTNFFDCKNPKDAIAEFFYVMANLYSSDDDYKLSNFYLKISLFLNKNFIPNKALLAENFYYQKKDKEAKNVYFSIKKLGPVYSWHSSQNIASIMLNGKGKKASVKSLEKAFNLLKDPSFKHYYDLANFYKDNENFKESIKYYTLALQKIKNDHFLVPKILDRRGTSFERIGDWESAEKDLMKSLKILPDQAHTLNYLAYTWIDRGINLDQGLVMLKKAMELRKNDGYITDSIGWAYYAKKDYIKAKFFLEKAVELMPLDPVINDHYADSLWMLNKNIQARYIWSSILKSDKAKKNLKTEIKKKLVLV